MDEGRLNSHPHKESDDFKKMVMCGDFCVPGNIGRKTLRVFISSTFKDTQLERNYLMKDVYPGLRKFCESYGLDLHMLDLRWGIRDPSTNDHMTTEICLSEIERCYNESIPGPCFVFLSGNRYGYRALPRLVNARIFEILLDDVKNPELKEYVLGWYRKDENALPAQYVLQPISSHVKGFGKVTDESEKTKCLADWQRHESKLHLILGPIALASTKLQENEKIPWKISVTEKEVRHGILKKTDASTRCFVLKRDLLIGSLKDKALEIVQDYLDHDLGPVENMREIVDRCEVPSGRLTLPLGEKGLEDKRIPEYLKDFGAAFKSLMKTMISTTLSLMPDVDKLTAEVLTHVNFCLRREREFHGRKGLVEEGLLFFQIPDRSTRPLVVFGGTGVGKTSFLAKLVLSAKELFTSQPNVCPITVVRFCGITPHSSTLNSIIDSIHQQISAAYLGQKDHSWQHHNIHAKMLKKAFALASETRPLLLFIDSLDQLDDILTGQSNFKWILDKLPRHVYMVISTLKGSAGCLSTFQTLKIPEENYLEIPTLSLDDATDILQGWLHKVRRTLTSGQLEFVYKAATDQSIEEPSALRLRLLYDIAVRWSSYDTPRTLPVCVTELIDEYLGKVEEEHGSMLVMYMFGLLCASRYGLSENDLIEVLSCCEEVLSSVLQYHEPPIRRLPHVVFARLKSSLGEFLVERGVHDKAVLAWYHRQFMEAAKEKYLRKMRTGFADILRFYFEGALHRRFPERQISHQPLFWINEENGKVLFNVQKLRELPHVSLTCSYPRAVVHVLCDLQFIAAKLEAGLSRELLHNFSEAKKIVNSVRLEIYDRFVSSEIHFLQYYPQYILQRAINYPDYSIIHQEGYKFINRQLELIPWNKALAAQKLVFHVNKSEGPKACFLTLGEYSSPVFDLKFLDTNLLCCQGYSLLIWDVLGGVLKRDLVFPDDVLATEILHWCSGNVNEKGVISLEAEIAVACKDSFVYLWHLKFTKSVQTKLLGSFKIFDMPFSRVKLASSTCESDLLAAGISYTCETGWAKDNLGEIKLWQSSEKTRDTSQFVLLNAVTVVDANNGLSNGFVTAMAFVLSGRFLVICSAADMMVGMVTICSVPALQTVWTLSSQSQGIQALFPKGLDVRTITDGSCQLLISSKDEFGLVLLSRKQDGRVAAELLGRYRGSPASFLPGGDLIVCADEEKALVFRFCPLSDNETGESAVVDEESKWEDVPVMGRQCHWRELSEQRESSPMYTYTHFRSQRSSDNVQKIDNSSLALTLLNILIGHSDGITHVAVRGDMIATATAEGVAKLWDLDLLSALPLPKAHVSPVAICKKLPDDTKCLTVSHYPEDSIKVWNSQTGELISSLSGLALNFLHISGDLVSWRLGKRNIYIASLSDFNRSVLGKGDIKYGDKIVMPHPLLDFMCFVFQSSFICLYESCTDDLLLLNIEKRAFLRLSTPCSESTTLSKGSLYLTNSHKLLSWISIEEASSGKLRTILHTWSIESRRVSSSRKAKAARVISRPGLYVIAYTRLQSGARAPDDSELVRLESTSIVAEVCFTHVLHLPNASNIFTCTRDGFLQKRALEDFTQLNKTLADSSGVTSLNATPDAYYLVTSSCTGWICIWNTEDLSKMAAFCNDAAVTSLDIFISEKQELFVNAGDNRGQFIVLKV